MAGRRRLSGGQAISCLADWLMVGRARKVPGTLLTLLGSRRELRVGIRRRPESRSDARAIWLAGWALVAATGTAANRAPCGRRWVARRRAERWRSPVGRFSLSPRRRDRIRRSRRP